MSPVGKPVPACTPWAAFRAAAAFLSAAVTGPLCVTPCGCPAANAGAARNARAATSNRHARTEVFLNLILLPPVSLPTEATTTRFKSMAMTYTQPHCSALPRHILQQKPNDFFDINQLGNNLLRRGITGQPRRKQAALQGAGAGPVILAAAGHCPPCRAGARPSVGSARIRRSRPSGSTGPGSCSPPTGTPAGASEGSRGRRPLRGLR